MLAACAPEFGIDVSGTAVSPVPVTVDLVRPSGEVVRYALELEVASGEEVRVREQIPRRHPSHCPDRHINQDGWFCTHWTEGDPLPVVDPDAAREWWTLLLRYLERQETASTLRKWPGATRAHGAAARYQSRAEEISKEFGDAFDRDLRKGAFKVVAERKRGRHRLQLLRSGKRVNRLTSPPGTLTHPRMPCPCDAGRLKSAAIDQCGAHALALAQFIHNLHRWTTLEEQFVRDLKDRQFKCCGTLQLCPFA